MRAVGFPFLGLLVCSVILVLLAAAGVSVYYIVRANTRRRNIS